MISVGWCFRLNPDYVFKFASGPNLNNYYFYQDFSNQPDGPKALPATMNFGTTDFAPALLLYGEDATTSGWINRGTLGGTLNAVNIRSQDIQLDTPYKTTVAKGVRCMSEATGSIERYYEFTDSTILDLNQDDLYFEAVYCRPGGSPALATIWNKRNTSATTNVGYAMSSANTSNMTLQIREIAGALRTASVTTTINSWCYAGGFLDYSDGATTGMRIYRGNDSSGVVAHGSTLVTSNALNFRVGAQQAAAVVDQDIILVYLAIYKAADLGFPGGAATEALITPMMRERQMILAGTKPLKAPASTQYSDVYRISHRVRNGVKKGYRTGSGFTCTDDFLSGSTTQTALYFNTSIGANAVTGETLSSWLPVNTTVTNNATISSPIDTWLTAGPSSLIGTAGTSVKGINLDFVPGNSSPRNFQFFARAGNKTSLHVEITGVVTNPQDFYINLTTGAITYTLVNTGVMVMPYVDGWWLIQTVYLPTALDDADFLLTFTDAISTPTCTGDGSTINGYIYGPQITALTTNISEFMPINLTSETAGSPVMNFVGTATTSPYSLWTENFSETAVQSTPTAPVPIAYQTDGSNIANLTIGGAGANMRFSTVGILGGATQWNIAINSGSPDWIGSTPVRSAASIATNDIKLLGESGILGTDTVATPPINQTVIRVGANANNTAQGRAIQTTKSAIFNKAIATVGEE